LLLRDVVRFANLCQDVEVLIIQNNSKQKVNDLRLLLLVYLT
jgi:hypothetical protein